MTLYDANLMDECCVSHAHLVDMNGISHDCHVCSVIRIAEEWATPYIALASSSMTLCIWCMFLCFCVFVWKSKKI